MDHHTRGRNVFHRKDQLFSISCVIALFSSQIIAKYVCKWHLYNVFSAVDHVIDYGSAFHGTPRDTVNKGSSGARITNQPDARALSHITEMSIYLDQGKCRNISDMNLLDTIVDQYLYYRHIILRGKIMEIEMRVIEDCVMICLADIFGKKCLVNRNQGAMRKNFKRYNLTDDANVYAPGAFMLYQILEVDPVKINSLAETTIVRSS